MKATKKLIAVILSLVFAISFAVPAMAVVGNPTGNTTVTGEGEVVFVDLEIYEVTLPTSATLSFILDPWGLTELEDGDEALLSDLTGGRVLPKSEIPATVLNESAVPITLTLEIKATTEAGDDSENDDEANFIGFDTNFATTKAKVFADDDLNVLLYVVPSKDGINSVDDDYLPADLGFVLGEDDIEMVFVLPEADYMVTNNGGSFEGVVVEDTGNGTQFQIGGYVNNNADWTNFTADVPAGTPSEVGLSAVFAYKKFDKADDLFGDGFDEDAEAVTGVAFMFDPDGDSLADSVTLDADAKEVLAGGPKVTLLRGASGDTPLGNLTAVNATTIIRLDGLTGKVASDLTKVTIFGTELARTTHYTVTVNDGLLQITFTASNTWFASALANSNKNIVITVSGVDYTFQAKA